MVWSFSRDGSVILSVEASTITARKGYTVTSTVLLSVRFFAEDFLVRMEQADFAFTGAVQADA
jgi:hypothetical protein